MVQSLLRGDFELAILDLDNEIMWIGAINGAANGVSSTKDLANGAAHFAGTGSWAHGAGDLGDVIHGDVAIVLDVLHLLAIAWGLLERLDDHRGGGGDDGDLSYSLSGVRNQ